MVGKQNADSGCFSGVLRRLLCQGSLQTHPSDQIPESNRADFDVPKKESLTQDKMRTPGTPGVVARLMGLDSLPGPNWVPTENAPDSVTRSRSVNFMDYLLKFDLSQAAAQHRRVRTSVSFREVPVSLHQQNNDLLVLYLDGVDEKKQIGSKVRKSGVEFGDLKQKKEEKSKKNTRERLVVKKKESQEKNKRVSKFIDEPRRVSVKKHSKINNNCKGAKDLGVVLPSKKSVNRESGAISKKRSPMKPIHQKEVLSRPKVTLEKIKELEAAAECSSENSSPVSVLDVSDFSIHDDTPFSVLEKDPMYMDLDSKWKSSSRTMESDYPSPNSTRILSNNDNIEPRLIQNSQNSDYYLELVTKLCKLTEEAIMQSNWMPKKVLNFDDYEEICVEFGEHILATLLHQVVEELGGFNVENSAV